VQYYREVGHVSYVIFDCTQLLTFNLNDEVDINLLLSDFKELNFKINTEVKQIKKTHLDKWVKSYFIELVNDEFIGEFEDWKEKDDIPESIITFGKLIVKLANNEIISGLSVILVHYANELVEKDKVFSQEIKINDIYEGLYHSSCFGISGNIIILNIIN
jgi:hypothetical protein